MDGYEVAQRAPRRPGACVGLPRRGDGIRPAGGPAPRCRSRLRPSSRQARADGRHRGGPRGGAGPERVSAGDSHASRQSIFAVRARAPRVRGAGTIPPEWPPSPSPSPPPATSSSAGRAARRAAGRRRRAAFAPRSSAATGAGLLHLGAREARTRAPAGARVLARLRARPSWRRSARCRTSRTQRELGRPRARRRASSSGSRRRRRRCAGGEYLTPHVLARALGRARPRLARGDRGRDGHRRRPGSRRATRRWSVVGRVHLHLAENRARPGASLRVPRDVHDRARAEREAPAPAARRRRPRGVLRGRPAAAPRAAPARCTARPSGARSCKALADSGRLFQPQAWTPARGAPLPPRGPRARGERRRRPVPGLVERPARAAAAHHRLASASEKPAGARARRAARLRRAAHARRRGAHRGRAADAARRGERLVLFKGRWVEVDRERLDELLRRWQEAQRRRAAEGVSFVEAMRLARRRRSWTLGGDGVRRGRSRVDRRPRRRVARRDARGAARRPRRRGGGPGRGAPHRAPPLPARGGPLARDARAPRPRRLPRRRHGAREDRPGARAAPRC